MIYMQASIWLANSGALKVDISDAGMRHVFGCLCYNSIFLAMVVPLEL